MNRALLLPALALPALLGSCQTMSAGLIGIEARAMVLDDAEIDDVQDGGTDYTDADVDLEGYGVHAMIMTPVLDVIGGVDQRDYENDDAQELTLGLRKRVFEIWRLHPYIEASYRYGFDLDTGQKSEDYTGYVYGAGVLVDLSDALFLNLRVVQDVTTVETGTGDKDIDGLVGTVGIGLRL